MIHIINIKFMIFIHLITLESYYISTVAHSII